MGGIGFDGHGGKGQRRLILIVRLSLGRHIKVGSVARECFTLSDEESGFDTEAGQRQDMMKNAEDEVMFGEIKD